MKKTIIDWLVIKTHDEFKQLENKCQRENIWIENLVIGIEYIERPIKIPWNIDALYFPLLKRFKNISFFSTHEKIYNKKFFIVLPLKTAFVPASIVSNYRVKYNLLW
jgi:hypothetical protein